MHRRLVSLLAHASRMYLRSPLRPGKRFVWQRIVKPYVAWRSDSYTAVTRLGVRLRCTFPDELQQHIFFFGVWEPHITRYMVSVLKPGDTFIDIGANIGYHSLLASWLVGASGRVIAIEASPDTLARLNENIALNGAGNIQVINMAVSDRPGQLPVYRNVQDPGETTTLDWRGLGAGYRLETTVTAAPLPSIIERPVITHARLIKIDIEGGEWDVVQGLRLLLKECARDVEFLVEINREAVEQRGADCRQFIQIFADEGFRAYEIRNSYLVFDYLHTPVSLPIPLREGNFDQRDILFSRRNPTAVVTTGAVG